MSTYAYLVSDVNVNTYSVVASERRHWWPGSPKSEHSHVACASRSRRSRGQRSYRCVHMHDHPVLLAMQPRRLQCVTTQRIRPLLQS